MKSLLLSFLLILVILYSGCSSSKKFTEENYGTTSDFTDNSSPIRVLVDEQKNMFTYPVDAPVELKSENKTIAVIKNGTKLVFNSDGRQVTLSYKDKTYRAAYFQIIPDEDNKLKVKEKNYKGTLRISPNNGNIQVINTLKLEEYLKGVLPSEMPIGKGSDNFEALKAFAICARTYAFMHLNSTGNYDIYSDTRDQVYNGYDVEKSITTKAILETKGLLLTYKDKPAVIFYHSTCGGYTEDAVNVFSSVKDAPYLQSLKDGEPSYCIISNKFQWKETYTAQEFTSRIKTAGLISGPSWTLKSAEVKSRFVSGRIKDLVLTFTDSSKEKIVTLNGNAIRSIIRNTSNSSILYSNNFEIALNDSNCITITGKGYGHGVGLCQFGAIYLSRSGKPYTEILSHYYPGTSITRYYD